MTQKYFGSEGREKRKREIVLGKCFACLLPNKDSYWVIAKDAGKQKCRLPSSKSCTSTMLNVLRIRSTKSVPNCCDYDK